MSAPSRSPRRRRRPPSSRSRSRCRFRGSFSASPPTKGDEWTARPPADVISDANRKATGGARSRSLLQRHRHLRLRRRRPLPGVHGAAAPHDHRAPARGAHRRQGRSRRHHSVGHGRRASRGPAPPSKSTSSSSRRGPGSARRWPSPPIAAPTTSCCTRSTKPTWSAIRWRYPQDEVADVERLRGSRRGPRPEHSRHERQPRRAELRLQGQRREGPSVVGAHARFRRRAQDVRPIPALDAESRGAGALRALRRRRDPDRQLPRAERLLRGRPAVRPRGAAARSEGPGNRAHRAATAEGAMDQPIQPARDRAAHAPPGSPRERTSIRSKIPAGRSRGSTSSGPARGRFARDPSWPSPLVLGFALAGALVAALVGGTKGSVRGRTRTTHRGPPLRHARSRTSSPIREVPRATAAGARRQFHSRTGAGRARRQRPRMRAKTSRARPGGRSRQGTQPRHLRR